MSERVSDIYPELLAIANDMSDVPSCARKVGDRCFLDGNILVVDLFHPAISEADLKAILRIVAPVLMPLESLD